MSFISEYKSSLKGIEAEEIFDLIFYRPVAFLFVKATFRINITPNQVSILAMLCGITAGVFFSLGTLSSSIIAGLLYFTCNVLDCADGQIARLKHNGTKVGRIIDGSIDYIVSIAVFTGIAMGLVNSHYEYGIPLYWLNLINIEPHYYIWILTVLAALSSAMHSFFYDFYRNKFLEIVYNKANSLEGEIIEFEAEKQRMEKDGEGGLNKLLITVYLIYSRLQLKLQRSKKSRLKIEPPVPHLTDKADKEKAEITEKKLTGKRINTDVDEKAYYKHNKVLLRLWSFTGSTSHITICIICALLNRMELFLLICLIPMNIFMFTVYLLQKRSNSLLKI